MHFGYSPLFDRRDGGVLNVHVVPSSGKLKHVYEHDNDDDDDDDNNNDDDNDVHTAV